MGGEYWQGRVNLGNWKQHSQKYDTQVIDGVYFVSNYLG